MERQADGVTWVLGFDGSCATCSALAKRIDAVAGGKVVFRSLRDAEVQAWREQVFGANAPWTPTLFKVSGDGVQAWTGTKLSWRLMKVVGPATTWRMLRAIGDVAEGNPAQPCNPQRRQFLRVASGAVASAMILSGKQSISSVAAQTTTPDAKGSAFSLAQLRVRTQREVAGAERDRLQRDLLNRPAVQDVITVGRAANAPRNGKAAYSELEDGNSLLASSWEIGSNRVLVYYELDKPVDGFRYRHALLYQVAGDTATLVASNVNATRFVPPGQVQPLDNPSDCFVCNVGGRKFVTECYSYSIGCIASVCIPCASSCGNPVTCLACLLVICPLSAAFGCCTSSFTGCKYCYY